MRQVKEQITFRLDTEKIHWLRTCAEIEDRTIVSVVEDAINTYFYWKNQPEYPRNISN
jgi:hypothetical protein